MRAKGKIKVAGIPYEVPALSDLPERLDAVLRVIYLVFNEGYRFRHDLSGEAIRLGRLLAELLPDPEVLGLLALMLLNDSRRTARLSAQGDIVLLEEQDRLLWDRAEIAEGVALVERALAALPAEKREAFVLKHVEGMSYEEMATVTGARIPTLKMRVHRAREALLAALEEVVR